MSLHHIAQHLRDQGRGPDDMLVHMTSGEVKALQGLAQAHGGSLTTNPHTGLPEAGILSSVLPMALGALAVATGQVEFLPLIAAGVGAADYAITGSLTQGLMAGLGTWSGGSLAGGIDALGGEAINKVAEEAGTQAIKEAAPAIITSNMSAALPAGATIAPETAGQIGNINDAATAFKEGAINADQYSQLANKFSSAYADTANPMSRMGQGLSNAGNTGVFDSGANAGNFAMNNKMALAGTALPLLTGSGDLFGNKAASVPGVSNQSNPMGMKKIPRDANGNPIFSPSLPSQPTPPYKATYPNYVTNPYNAYGAAEGGVMKMAVGGSAPLIGTPAQNTTMNSSVGNNTMFPMSEMARSYYATPTNLPAGINNQNNNQPASPDGSMPGYGPRLDTNTGQMMNNFADGGQVRSYATGGQLEVNGSINVNNGNGIGNEVVGANGYTPAGGQPWGGGQYSGQTTAQQTPSTYGQGQPTSSQSPYGVPPASVYSGDFGMVNTNGSGGSTIGNGTGIGLGNVANGSINPNNMDRTGVFATNYGSGLTAAQHGQIDMGHSATPAPVQALSPTPQFAQGGIARYNGADYGSMISGQNEINSGLSMATRRPLRETPTPDVGIYSPEAAVKDMDALSSTMYYLNKISAPLPKGMKALNKPSTLGAITHTPTAQAAQEAAAAQKAKQSIASEESSKDAKEGGLMAMASGGNTPYTGGSFSAGYNPHTSTNYQGIGLPAHADGTPAFNSLFSMFGLNPTTGQPMQTQMSSQPTQMGGTMNGHIYQPNYQNFAQMPSQGIPMPTRNMAIPAQGYALDPAKMMTNTQIKTASDQRAWDKAHPSLPPSITASADLGYDVPLTLGGGEAGASGGLPRDFRHYAMGGQIDGHLGGYSDGGRLLRGPGDGVSDSIPATIGGKQPARLAEGEFVIPARIVSELGNGSTDAGAKRLYAMMDRIKAKRSKTKNIAADTKAYKYLPA
jgi:hypothetical protein